MAQTRRAEGPLERRPRQRSRRGERCHERDLRGPGHHWCARTEASEGKTSPEELLATAHAACYSMAVSNELSKAGFVPTRVDVVVEIDADKAEQGLDRAAQPHPASCCRAEHRRGDVPAGRRSREGRLPDLPRDRGQRRARARRHPRRLGSADRRHRARRVGRPRLFIERIPALHPRPAISDG